MIDYNNIGHKNLKNDSAGDRTQNLWFRRPAPYPLGHGVIAGIDNATFLLHNKGFKIQV